MARLDIQNRLLIPRKLLATTNINLKEDVRLYLRGKEFFLDNPSLRNSSLNCLGRVLLDSNGRIYISKMIRDSIDLNPKTNITFYLCDGKIICREI